MTAIQLVPSNSELRFTFGLDGIMQLFLKAVPMFVITTIPIIDCAIFVVTIVCLQVVCPRLGLIGTPECFVAVAVGTVDARSAAAAEVGSG